MLTTEYLMGMVGKSVEVIYKYGGSCRIVGRLVAVTEYRRWFSRYRWYIELEGHENRFYLVPTDEVHAHNHAHDQVPQWVDR